MTDEDPEDNPVSPWKLTQGRIVILVLGVLIALIAISALRGGFSDYQTLRDASLTPPAPAAQPPQ
jgi:hypothetical protein